MPFTLSHPAIILPFNKFLKKYLYVSAIVIGSMAPDFEYFIRLRPVSQIGHTVLGIFIFDLPLVLLVWFIWEKLVKTALVRNLPHPFDVRYSRYASDTHSISSAKNLIIFIVSALVGIFSHFFWDFFTHFSPLLQAILPTLLNATAFGMPVYRILQQISTVVGLLVVIGYLLSYKDVSNDQALSAKNKFFFWLWFILSTGIFFGLFFYIRLQTPLPIGLASLTVLSVSSGFCGLVAASFLHRQFKFLMRLKNTGSN